MKPYFSPQATNQILSVVESRDVHALTKMASAFRAGANPWSQNNQGVQLLDLCLQDGRHSVLSLWTDAARRVFHQRIWGMPSGHSPSPSLAVAEPADKTMAMMRNNPHLLDLVGTFVHLTKNDRQIHLRRLLFPSGHKTGVKGADEKFIHYLATHSSPQRWQAISNTLLVFPHLNDIKVPQYPLSQEDLWKGLTVTAVQARQESGNEPSPLVPVINELIRHAPIQVLLNHLSSSQHRVNLDWRVNPILLERLRHFVDPTWGEAWKEAGVVLYGSDAHGDTLLHHYLRNTPTNMLNASAIEFLVENGSRWSDRNADRQSCDDLAQLHKGSPLLDPSVAHLLNSQTLAVQQFHPIGRVLGR